jgi:uncharacterized damage-inducible protein DinB
MPAEPEERQRVFLHGIDRMTGEESMNLTMICAIYGYNAWATRRILDCCDQLSADQLKQEDDTPWGSIRNQLVHQFIVHRRWLSWADGSLSGEEAYALQADPADFPDADSIRMMWDSLEQQTQRYLDRLTEDELNRELRVEYPGAEFAISVGEMMLHIAHHSMQHRTETSMALTRLGVSPGDIDYLFYVLGRR